MSAGDSERAEMQDRLDAPFWIKAWDWLEDRYLGKWFIIVLFVLLFIWWKV